MQISTPRATLTTEAILALLNAAVARAKALDVRIHVAVCDSAARRVGFVTMDGALPIAATTAERKAFTSANMNMSTGQWTDYVNSLLPGEQKIVDAIEGYVAARGGFPVRQGGMLLGSVGISGASQEIDADIGHAALAAIGAESVEG
jgi:uncharacterized protein GlcG (DUF336 family)